jgi:hypothetical protein
MCGKQAFFNAASVAREAIGSVEVLLVQHQPRNSALEFVNFAVRQVQLLTNQQGSANSSRVATRTALDNSESILSKARPKATPSAMPEASAIAWRRAGWSTLAAQGRPRFIE